MRIGQGIDVHHFSGDAERELWLGLVHVPDGPGLEGHSDADVLSHAITDAILGAIAPCVRGTGLGVPVVPLVKRTTAASVGAGSVIAA